MGFFKLSVLVLGIVSGLYADLEDDTNEPPLAGQPENFSGAVGSYKVATIAEPTALQAEDPLTFTVRISGQGPAGHQPRRPDLRRLPAFGKRFLIENLAQEKSDAGGGVWKFRYRLKPLDAAVREIPAFRFTYFKPGVFPREKGFRSAYADAIPLTVRPRAEVRAVEVQGQGKRSKYREEIYQLKEGAEAVLRRDEPFAFPGWFGLSLLVFGPPGVAVGVYLYFCWYQPVTLRRVRQRRSRAAGRALARLNDRKNWSDSERDVHQIASNMAEYLRERWELKGAEPTPAEVAEHFRKIGCPRAEQLAKFFRACEVVRFAAAPGDGKHLLDQAREMILVLEEQA